MAGWQGMGEAAPHGLPCASRHLGPPRGRLCQPRHIRARLQVSSELLQGTRLQIRHVEYESDEYCHWTFPDDNPEHAEPSYMMARRLTPHSKRRPPEPDSIIERSKKIMLDERPPVRPSGKRAAFIQAIEDAKAAAEQRKATLAASAWHQVGYLWCNLASAYTLPAMDAPALGPCVGLGVMPVLGAAS